MLSNITLKYDISYKYFFVCYSQNEESLCGLSHNMQRYVTVGILHGKALIMNFQKKTFCHILRIARQNHIDKMLASVDYLVNKELF